MGKERDEKDESDSSALENPKKWLTEGDATDTANESEPPREGPAAPGSLPG